MCTTDEVFLDRKEGLAACRLSNQAKDPAVYGVVSHRTYNEDDTSHLTVYALGLGQVLCKGSIANGDYLCSSDVPGVAERQDDDLLHAYTIGKVTRGDSETGIRLVNVTLHCG